MVNKSIIYIMCLRGSSIAYTGTIDVLAEILHSNMESENIKDYDFYEVGKWVQMKQIKGIELVK